jgi:NifU-like protein
MGAEALQAAVFNWAQRRGVDLQELGVDIRPEEQEEGRIVCQCFSLTEPYIRRKVKELGLKTIPQITAAIKAGGACMSCHHKPGGLQDILDELWGPQETRFKEVPELPEPAAPGEAQLSPYQLGKRIEQVIEENVRPTLAKDGGDIEIVDIKGTIVYCRLRGACATCFAAETTMKVLVEQSLKDNVDERIRVIAV